MSVATFSWTPPEGGPDPFRKGAHVDADPVAAWARYQKALTWKAPAGHSSWCDTQYPGTRRHVGTTAMAKPGCTCAKSSLARTLRKINEREAA